MKKTYINPLMEIVKIVATQQILAGSDKQVATKGDYGTGEGITLGGHDDDFDW